MRISRLFIPTSSIDKLNETVTICDREQIRQITSVLRLRNGDRLDVLDGEGKIYHCRLDSSGETTARNKHKSSISCRIDSTDQAAGESAVALVVALPVLKNARFEWAIEKLTELGASTIVPLIVERSVVIYQTDQDRSSSSKHRSEPKVIPVERMHRWRSIAREAAEQCERALVPNVVSPEKFSTFVKSDLYQSAVRLISAERSDASSLGDCLAALTEVKTICIAIGAEGGFTETEFALSFAHGFKGVSLGRRILRAETAAVYAASLVTSHLDR